MKQYLPQKLNPYIHAGVARQHITDPCFINGNTTGNKYLNLLHVIRESTDE